MYHHCLKAAAPITATRFLVSKAVKPSTISPFLFSSAATRTMATVSSGSRVSDRIIHDHRELESYYNKIKSSATPDEKTRWQNQFIWELARHSVAEELIVYPAFEKHLPGGEGSNIASKDRKEHQQVKDLLYKFQTLTASNRDFEKTIDELWSVLSEHIKEEEKDDLPVLESAVGQEESVRLGKKFDRTKHFVPTKSHPMAGSEGGIYESAMGLLGAPMDKLMDLFERFPPEEETKV